MDEFLIRIEGVQQYVWRAVDTDGVVLDILVQPRRDANAAKRFFTRLDAKVQIIQSGRSFLSSLALIYGHFHTRRHEL